MNLLSVKPIGICVLAFAYATLVSFAVAAQDARISPFLGTYIGVANAVDIDTGQVEQRDIVVEIKRYADDGFVIASDVIIRVNGQRAVPGVKRRFGQLLFRRADDGDYYAEAWKANPFRKRDEPNVVEGDPVRWAKIEDGRITVYSFVLRDDGRFELEIYGRMRTDQGLEITFERIVDGEVTRRVTGQTVRAK